jgi:hypothetical protein
MLGEPTPKAHNHIQSVNRSTGTLIPDNDNATDKHPVQYETVIRVQYAHTD